MSVARVDYICGLPARRQRVWHLIHSRSTRLPSYGITTTLPITLRAPMITSCLSTAFTPRIRVCLYLTLSASPAPWSTLAKAFKMSTLPTLSVPHCEAHLTCLAPQTVHHMDDETVTHVVFDTTNHVPVPL